MAAFMHSQALLKDLAVAGGMILLAIHGPGRLSVDAWRAAASLAAHARRLGIHAVLAIVSPSSSIIASRMRNFCGLPVTVIGSSVRKRT